MSYNFFMAMRWSWRAHGVRRTQSPPRSLSVRRIGRVLPLVCLAAGLLGMVPQVSTAQEPPPGGNLLKNPGFDWPVSARADMCNPGAAKGNVIVPHDWEPYWTCKSGKENNQDQINRAPEFRMMTAEMASDRVHTYPTAGSFFTFWSLNRSAGFYQLVPNIAPGTRLRFNIWVNLLTTDSDVLPLNSSRAPGGLQARACMHTTGGMGLIPDMTDAKVVCGAWSRPYDTWGEVSVEAVAAAGQVVVIIDTTADYPVKHNDVHVDDASLTVVGAASASAPAAPAASAPAASAPAAVAPAAAAPSTSSAQVTVKGETANIRSAPNLGGTILNAETQGKSFNVRGYSSDKQWWQIEYAGGTGGIAYVHNSVVTPNGAAQAALTGSLAPAPAAPAQAAAPAPTAAPPAAAPATGGTPQVVVTTAGDRLNVRDAPGATGQVIAKASNGAVLDVKGISADRQWWQVAIPNGTGWVMASWVTPNTAAKQVAPA